MPECSFYQLGLHPDAHRLKRLYNNPGVDYSVTTEFEATVKAYRELSVDEVAARVDKKYGGCSPEAKGALLVVGTIDAGMAFWGVKDFQRVNRTTGVTDCIEGINVSAWLLKQHRNRGFGNILLKHATDMARKDVTEQSSAWYGREVWTSIKPENTASRLACSAVGFTEIGVQLDQTDRLLYTPEIG